MSKHVPAIRARVQQVFVVDRLRPITERTATILVCGKRTWAEIYDRYGNPKRKLLGTHAFFTRKAAEVRKLGELRALAERNFPSWHSAGRACDAARGQLAEYNKTGTIH